MYVINMDISQQHNFELTKLQNDTLAYRVWYYKQI